MSEKKKKQKKASSTQTKGKRKAAVPLTPVRVSKVPEEKRVTAQVVDASEVQALSRVSSEGSLAVQDPLAAYLADIRKYPLLTREHEEELAKRYFDTGDAKAAEMLVTANLRFVVKVAAEYSKFGARMIDLIQEGNVGLLHAVKEFNPYKGVRLITYAVWWIRGYIQEYLMRQFSVVRIGTNQTQRKLFYQLQKEREALESLGMEATPALLGSRLGVDASEVEDMSRRLASRDVSLDASPGDSGASTLISFRADEHVGPDEDLSHREELSLLSKSIEVLRPTLNEREIFLLDHRLLADEPLTLQEIGDKYNITREAVRQLENRLLGKLKMYYQTETKTAED